MTNSLQKAVNETFQAIPLLSAYSLDDFEIIELFSHSNKNYRLLNDKLDVILRIPKTETSQYINRKAEINNENIAFSLGLTAQCLWQNEQGISVTQTIPDAKNLSPVDLRKSDIIYLLAHNLQKLHGCGQKFEGQVNLQQLLSHYFGLLTTQQKSQFAERYEKARGILQTLNPAQESLVPSHNDLNENNLLLDNNHKLWMIDWEYSSMSSPYWDLATICNSGEYLNTHCLTLLDAYNRLNHPLELEPLLSYRQLLSLLSDCWLAAITNKHEGAGSPLIQN